MLTLLLADAELEPLPPELARLAGASQRFRPKSKRVSRALLDDAVHHEELKKLPEGERRGRPDIAHFFLLLALDSLANKRGALRVLVHTRNDELIRIAPETRIMRHYPKFVKLMEQLFEWRAVPQGAPLLTIEEGWPLARVLWEAAPGKKVLLHEAGRAVRPHAYFGDLARLGADATVVIGGFSKGDFRSPARALVPEAVSVAPEPLSVWSVESAILAAVEDALCHDSR